MLSDKNVKAIFINIFGGILRVDRLATGVVAAARKLDVKDPIVLRLEGANVEEGLSYHLTDYARAATVQTKIYRAYQRFFAGCDVLISPTITVSPRPWSELYPTEIRGTGQGFCYSLGRAVGAFFPAIIGVWSARSTLGAGIGAMTAAGYALVAAAAWALPETRGRALG